MNLRVIPVRIPTLRFAFRERYFSSPRKILYRGSFGEKIRMLRRLSLSSTVVSTLALPVTQHFVPDLISLSLVGQIAIFSAISLSSLTSTVFLQAVTHAYVHSMNTHPGNLDIYMINRISWLGRLVQDNVNKGHLKAITSSEHPFANFKDEDTGKYFYFEESDTKQHLLKH